ncbi:MAG: hypothetical protein HYV16_13235 [Gammaproteobacteria bacterium]|nr:hypothetical protein [Gammaproteobacteria bacterium]
MKPYWRRYLAAAGLAAGLSGPARAEWVEWLAEAGLSQGHDDNIGLTAFTDDQQSERYWLLEGRAGRYFQFSDRTRLALALEAGHEQFRDFDGLDHERLGALLMLRHKFGVGADVPWLQLYGRQGKVWADDDTRSGWRGELGLRLGMGFGERLDVDLGLSRQRFRADEEGEPHPRFLFPTDVFDSDAWRLRLAGHVLLAQDWLLSLGLEHFDGDFASGCPSRGVTPTVQAERISRIVLDPVFGGCTYALDATADAATLDLSYALSGHWSVVASWRRQWGESRTLDYRDEQLTAGLLYSF